MILQSDKKISSRRHESQVPLDTLFEDAINPLPLEDDFSTELPFINPQGFNQLEFISNKEDNLIFFD